MNVLQVFQAPMSVGVFFIFENMNTADFRKGFPNQKYGRHEVPSVLNSPQKILILQGFATLRVAPRLPIQFYE